MAQDNESTQIRLIIADNHTVMANHDMQTKPSDLDKLQARAEAMVQGDFSGLGKSISANDDIERLRRALDVIGAHLQQAQANAEDYIDGLIRNQEAERQRLSRNLHDVVQRLITLGQGLHVFSAPTEGTTVFLHMPYAKDLMRELVCGMKIGADAPSALHKGDRYHFCSDACKALFESQPERFILKTP